MTEAFNKDQRAAFIKSADAWISSMSGAGTAADKFSAMSWSPSADLDDRTLEELFTEDDLAATIVERKVYDALRGGYELEWDGSTDEQAREVLDWAETTYDVTEEVKQADVWGRLFGGAGVVIGTGGEPDTPAMLGDDVGFLRAVAKPDLWGQLWYANPALQNYAKVAMYRMRVMQFGGQVLGQQGEPFEDVHESRIVPFYGIRTTDRQMFADKGWGKSVLHRVYAVLMKFESGFDSVLHTLLEQSVPRYKVKALLDLLASENGELLAKRFELINTAKSNYRAVILDQEEDFDRVEANLGPSSDVVDSAMVRVAGAAGMPVTLLFGRSPAGQNATGASDLENWNQQVASEQSLVLGPAIERIYNYLLAQADSPVKGVKNLRVNFPVVETLSRQEQINAYAQIAGADATYEAMGAATAAEIARKRSRQKGSLFPAVDMAHLKQLDDLQKDRILNPPDPMAMMGEETEGATGEEESDDDDPAAA